MKRQHYLFLLLLACCFIPAIAHAQAQAISSGVQQLHTVLQNVYKQMITLCAQVIGVCQAIAAFGTTFYIGVRVWKHIANAEPIDFFPLLRPFVICLLIGIFPQVLGVINGILEPSVTATAALVQKSNSAVQAILAKEANSVIDTSDMILVGPMAGGPKTDYSQYDQPTGSSDSGGGILSSIGSSFKFLAGGFVSGISFLIKYLLSIFFEILYFAAALCIDTIRTFHLVVLAILGPFAFAFSCFPGFEQSVTNWLAKYINIFLWLPIANIFGAVLGLIQQNMLQFNQQGGALSMFSPTNLAYLIFLVIGAIGYTTIPGLANYIVHSHTPNPLLSKVSGMASQAVGAAVGGATGGAGGAAMGASGGGSGQGGGMDTNAKGQSYDPYQHNRSKISG
jgi:conjugative transposon TraJ protein